MKPFSTLTMMAVLLVCFTISSQAQTTATWQGGVAGQPTNWNLPANWKEGKTPDEFSLVIIPADKLYYPVLKTEVGEIDALLVENGASLHLDIHGKLTILGETERMNVMTIYGDIQNDGRLDVHQEDGQQSMAACHIQGHGALINSMHDNLTASR